eukprot:5725586-Prymnesium_polylepis.1
MVTRRARVARRVASGESKPLPSSLSEHARAHERERERHGRWEGRGWRRVRVRQGGGGGGGGAVCLGACAQPPSHDRAVCQC